MQLREAAELPAFGPKDFEPTGSSGPEQRISRPSQSYWQDAWRRLRKNRSAIFSLVVVVGLALFSLFGAMLWRVDPHQQLLNRVLEGPSLRSSLVVLEALPPFERVVLAGVDPSPQASGRSLAAPASLEWVGEPSVQAVRLRWAPVAGASGYSLYRSETPPGGGYWGLPIGVVDGGNVVSFEDWFNLKPGTYHYSVLARNVDEALVGVTQSVEIGAGISLEEARALQPDAQPGQSLRQPMRPLGTDILGRDLLARLIEGGRVSLFIGFFAPFLAVLIGVTIGGISGFYGGKVDQWLMRFTDFVIALPFLLFMILLKVVIGGEPGEGGGRAILISLVVLSWTGAARLTRGQVLQLRESEFVLAARLLGATPFYQLLRHLLPNTLGVILVSFTFAIPTAIFAEAFLSFIGMGVEPPATSWGTMCNDGIKAFLTHPSGLLFPAAFISLAVLAFNLLGDGLRDALDPKLRGSE